MRASHDDSESSDGYDDDDDDDDDVGTGGDGAIAPPPSTPASGGRPVRLHSIPIVASSVSSSPLSSSSSSLPSSSSSYQRFVSAHSSHSSFISARVRGEAEVAAAAAAAATRRPLGLADAANASSVTLPPATMPMPMPMPPPSTPTPPPPPPPTRRTYTEEELRNRPRSNPRARTPLRNTSPMPRALNRSTVHDEDDDDDDGGGGGSDNGARSSGATNLAYRVGVGVGVGGGGRVTVGINAGAAVGSLRRSSRLAPTSGPERLRSSPYRDRRMLLAPIQRSARQGRPAKRKVRRWNNDRMVGVVSDLASTENGPRGERAANIFLRGEAEAGLFAIPNKPLNYRSEFARMTENEGGKYTKVRERFVRGEVASVILPHDNNDNNNNNNNTTKENDCKREKGKYGDGLNVDKEGAVTAAHLGRLSPRLRSVLEKACARTDGFASRIVRAFEEYLLLTRSSSTSSSFPRRDWDEKVLGILDEVLLRPPSSVINERRRQQHRPATEFCFPDRSSAATATAIPSSFSRAGFHRLLLHAACQFHGLDAKSRSSDVNGAPARIVCVTGTVRSGGARLVSSHTVNSEVEKRDAEARIVTDLAREETKEEEEGGSGAARTLEDRLSALVVA